MASNQVEPSRNSPLQIPNEPKCKCMPAYRDLLASEIYFAQYVRYSPSDREIINTVAMLLGDVRQMLSTCFDVESDPLMLNAQQNIMSDESYVGVMNDQPISIINFIESNVRGGMKCLALAYLELDASSESVWAEVIDDFVSRNDYRILRAFNRHRNRESDSMDAGHTRRPYLDRENCFPRRECSLADQGGIDVLSALLTACIYTRNIPAPGLYKLTKMVFFEIFGLTSWLVAPISPWEESKGYMELLGLAVTFMCDAHLELLERNDIGNARVLEMILGNGFLNLPQQRWQDRTVAGRVHQRYLLTHDELERLARELLDEVATYSPPSLPEVEVDHDPPSGVRYELMEADVSPEDE